MLMKRDEEMMHLDASLVTLATHYKAKEYSVKTFLFSYSSGYGDSHEWLLNHMFSLGLTNIGVERWDLDWA